MKITKSELQKIVKAKVQAEIKKVLSAEKKPEHGEPDTIRVPGATFHYEGLGGSGIDLDEGKAEALYMVTLGSASRSLEEIVQLVNKEIKTKYKNAKIEIQSLHDNKMAYELILIIPQSDWKA